MAVWGECFWKGKQTPSDIIRPWSSTTLLLQLWPALTMGSVLVGLSAVMVLLGSLAGRALCTTTENTQWQNWITQRRTLGEWGASMTSTSQCNCRNHGPCNWTPPVGICCPPLTTCIHHTGDAPGVSFLNRWSSSRSERCAYVGKDQWMECYDKHDQPHLCESTSSAPAPAPSPDQHECPANHWRRQGIPVKLLPENDVSQMWQRVLHHQFTWP